MSSSDVARKPIREGLFTPGLGDLGQIALIGAKCCACGETSFGASECCPNCGSDDVSTRPLTRTGILWTYTVVRHRPPGNYRGPEPFQPFGMGLVELTDGLRVLSRVDVELDRLEIGMPLELHPFVLGTDEAGAEIIAFTFRPL